jgi:hypothetical protein
MVHSGLVGSAACDVLEKEASQIRLSASARSFFMIPQSSTASLCPKTCQKVLKKGLLIVREAQENSRFYPQFRD